MISLHKAVANPLSWLLACILFFIWFPNLDLQVSNLFYDPLTKRFPANEFWWVKWTYTYTPEINKAVSLWALGVLLAAVWVPQRVSSRWRKAVIAWLLLMALGIGFLVDWVLKDHVGRPHPYQTIPYNGTENFVPVLHYQPLCEENCSFVSGHAAGGFVWMAWGMWRRRLHRQRWIWVGLIAGSVIGATRVMQGGHFLSDIVFSGWFMWLTYQLIRTVWIHRRYRNIRRHAHRV